MGEGENLQKARKDEGENLRVGANSNIQPVSSILKRVLLYKTSAFFRI
jgi:hypothetical protein